MQPFLKYFKVSILDIDICSQIKSCCFVRLLILLSNALTAMSAIRAKVSGRVG